MKRAVGQGHGLRHSLHPAYGLTPGGGFFMRSGKCNACTVLNASRAPSMATKSLDAFHPRVVQRLMTRAPASYAGSITISLPIPHCCDPVCQFHRQLRCRNIGDDPVILEDHPRCVGKLLAFNGVGLQAPSLLMVLGMPFGNLICLRRRNSLRKNLLTASLVHR